MIDGESSKAEFIWRYDCSYSDAYLIKITPDLTAKGLVKHELKLDVCTVTLKWFEAVECVSL